MARFSPEDSQAIFVSGGTALLANVRDGRRIAALADYTDKIADVAFSLCGSRIATASHEQTLRIWDSADGQLLMLYREQEPIAVHEGGYGSHYVGFTCLAFSPDGTRLAVGAGGWPRADF